MDQIIHRVLRFDRFALDLSRGCLRIEDRDIDLRPKAFEVLRHLAENAGQLVSKSDLYHAVWPNVVVSDDSLTHCVHELRQVLGDTEHRLIKTVARRGYLLNAPIIAPDTPFHSERTAEHHPAIVGGSDLPGSERRSPRRWTLAAAFVGIGFFGAVLSMPWLTSLANSTRSPLAMLVSLPAASELYTAVDAKHIAALADIKQLPLPAFQIRRPSPGISNDARRFIGVWVSGSGWLGSNRQFMLIVTHVRSDGAAEGYTVDGPPQPKSHIQDTTKITALTALGAQIAGDNLYFSGRHGNYTASLASQNRIEFKATFRDGNLGVVALDPAWTLVAAERVAAETIPQ